MKTLLRSTSFAASEKWRRSANNVPLNKKPGTSNTHFQKLTFEFTGKALITRNHKSAIVDAPPQPITGRVMSEPIILIKSAWMDYYDGRVGDAVIGAHAYVQQTGSGAEVNNFRKRNGFYYGYGPFNNSSMALHKYIIGVKPGAKFVDDVTVVWIAKAPDSRGVVVVGWYQHARLYAKYHYSGSSNLPSLARAKVSDCYRIPPDDRMFKIERSIRSGSVWYALDRVQLKKDVRKLIAGSYQEPTSLSANRRNSTDRDQVLAVERAAIKAVERHYEKRGFVIESRERENEGWDLLAKRGNITLRLEVKGTSQQEIRAELTPNEYAKALTNTSTYRICIVTDALSTAKVYIFRFSTETGAWRDADGMRDLTITELKGARLSA